MGTAILFIIFDFFARTHLFGVSKGNIQRSQYEFFFGIQ